MKKLLKSLVAILAAALLFIPIANAFDKVHGKIDEFEGTKYVDLSTTHPEILVIGSGIGMYFDRGDQRVKRATGVFRITGSGTVLKVSWKYYILTAAHVVIPSHLKIQLSKNIYAVTPCMQLVERFIFVGSEPTVQASIDYINEEYDIALLVLNGIWPAAFGSRYDLLPTADIFGSSPILERGDAVCVVVQQRGESGRKIPWYEVRYGKVIDIKPVVPSYNQDLLPWFNICDVTTDVKIYPGDSGSAVFAFENGRPVIIGVFRAAYLDYYGAYYSYFTRVDLVYWWLKSA